MVDSERSSRASMALALGAFLRRGFVARAVGFADLNRSAPWTDRMGISDRRSRDFFSPRPVT